MSQKTIKLNRPFFDIGFWVLTLAGIFVTIIASRVSMTALTLSLCLGLFLYIGFGLPRWIGKQERSLRAMASKRNEDAKWGFHSRDREGPWINFITYPLVKHTGLAKGKYFYSEWLVIHDGAVIVNPGHSTVDKKNKVISYDHAQRRTYAWDGCTPKRFFFWLAIIGTPDWWHQKEEVTIVAASSELGNKQVFWQKAHNASLIHDALYQYLDQIPIGKIDVDRLFYAMLCASGMYRVIAKLYFYAVHWFGGDGDRTNAPQDFSQFRISGLCFDNMTNLRVR
jgi:hypothetical protein